MGNDFIPAGWSLAESYRYLADAFRTALDLPEAELRETLAGYAEQCAATDDLQHLADALLTAANHLPDVELRLAAAELGDRFSTMAHALLGAGGRQ